MSQIIKECSDLVYSDCCDYHYRLQQNADKLLEMLTRWERVMPRLPDDTPAEDSLRANTLRLLANIRGEA